MSAAAKPVSRPEPGVDGLEPAAELHLGDEPPARGARLELARPHLELEGPQVRAGRKALGERRQRGRRGGREVASQRERCGRVGGADQGGEAGASASQRAFLDVEPPEDGHPLALDPPAVVPGDIAARRPARDRGGDALEPLHRGAQDRDPSLRARARPRTRGAPRPPRRA